MYSVVTLLSVLASNALAGGPGGHPTPAPGEKPAFSGPCTGTGTAKYYSIDTTNNNCGETCFTPDRYDTLHFFEPGLTKATTDYPCRDNSYTVYEGSPTHGAFGISVKLDLYGPTLVASSTATSETATETAVPADFRR